MGNIGGFLSGERGFGTLCRVERMSVIYVIKFKR